MAGRSAADPFTQLTDCEPLRITSYNVCYTKLLRVTVYRFIARNNERQLFPAIEQEWGSFGFGKPSQAQRMTLRDVQRNNFV